MAKGMMPGIQNSRVEGAGHIDKLDPSIAFSPNGTAS
jgi:hypothetical protein